MGGLDIIQRGGGMQTKSLRVQNKQGKEYVLRSVNKFPENAIPAPLRQTIAKEIVQDQISASNPYSALAVARLAEAAGIVHTNPQIVYLPDDPLLGIYRKDFGNALYLFEERETAGKIKDSKVEFFSTSKMLKELQKDNDNQVQQKDVLRARLFDLWIADWDRHDDQWRWYAQKGKNGLEFSPMPRDRDQAFFVNEGFFPKIASRKWLNPKFQGFGYDLKNVNGFMYNGRFFDRSFLNELDKKDWEKVIEDWLPRLSEDAIKEAFEDWPRTVAEKDREIIQDKLLARKNWLKEKSIEYYRFLAREVDVRGSKKDEEFQIKQLKNGKVEIEIRKINKSGKVTNRIYDRTFLPQETQEIRLYGLKGDDRFVWKGDGKREILIRIIPGEGKKTWVDSAQLSGKKDRVYVLHKEGTSIPSANSFQIKTAPDRNYLNYDRTEFRYDKLMPLVSIEYNKDDGIFLGAGVRWEKHGFKKNPFAAYHEVSGNFAFRTAAFNIEYKGMAVDLIKKWDLVWNADVKAPNYVFNYFGAGNNSDFNQQEFNIDFYQTRFNWYELNVGLQTDLGGSGKFSIGPSYQVYRFDPDENENTFITSPSSDIDPLRLDQAKFYGGITSLIEFDRRDNVKLPTRGFYFRQETKHLQGLNASARNFTSVSGEIRLFWAFRYPSKLVWANRLGGGKNFGEYEFFQGQTLGGMNNFRGSRRYRFNGDAVVYNNLEFRLQLFNFKSPILPATVGMLGFYDIGRVWLKGEKSNTWHNSIGGGIWLAPINQFVATFSVGFTREETLPFITFGYQF